MFNMNKFYCFMIFQKKIPELSEDKDDDSILNFFIQSFGILVGIGKTEPQ